MENHKKNIFILSPPDIFREEREIAYDTVKNIIEMGETDLDIKIAHNWNEPSGWLRKTNRIYLDAFYINVHKPLIGNEPQYDVVLTAKDIFSFDASLIFGYGIKYKSCIISLGELRKISDESKRGDYEKHLVYHEAGHMLGMPHRKEGNISYEMGNHCTNACSMREVESINSLGKFARDSNFIGAPYCKPCIEGLKNFFVL